VTAAAPTKIGILCSGGATVHKPWRLGFILEVGNRSPEGAGCDMMRRPDGVGYGYRLKCGNRKCRHAPEFSFKKWRKLVAGLDKARVDTLDIADLPF
jgi:hypothetical protein